MHLSGRVRSSYVRYHAEDAVRPLSELPVKGRSRISIGTLSEKQECIETESRSCGASTEPCTTTHTHKQKRDCDRSAAQTHEAGHLGEVRSGMLWSAIEVLLSLQYILLLAESVREY